MPDRKRDDKISDDIISDHIKASQKANDRVKTILKELERSLERQERSQRQKERSQQQLEQTERDFWARNVENLAEINRRLYKQQVVRNRRSNTDDQLSVSSEGEDSLTPQEILDNKLNEPEAVLTPNQSISLLNHCAELGEQNAASAAHKIVAMVVGNAGVGKSAFLNALLGCQMKAVRPIELGLPGVKRIVVVDPESPREEVMPIGHGGRSRTFTPQLAQDPDNPNKAYCDCPGFSDNRGAEINIANAINIRKILQQATGVKAVFLTDYHGLLVDRGSSIRNVEAMCRKMFGGADNLRRYQNSVLLGITKAPRYNTSGQPLSINSIRLRLNGSNSDIAQILANRIFLFDPLDRATDNPDFWSLERCRNEIAQLEHIPQQRAANLFQTTLTDGGQVHLLNTVQQLQPKIVNAITQGDEAALSRYWQLLQRLRVVERPEVEQLIEGQVLPAINVALQQLGNIESWTDQYNFDQAEAQITQLTQLIQQLPGARLDADLNALNQRLTHCRQQYAERQRMNTEEQRLEAERQRVNTENQRLERELTQLNEAQRRGEEELNQLREKQH